LGALEVAAAGAGAGVAAGVSSSTSGVARSRNFSAQVLCHFSISASGTNGKASLGKSIGNLSPVSGFLMLNSRTAVWMNGTCSSGPNRISIDCHLTNPRSVRHGIEGGANSFFVGCRLCWQPIEAYIHDMEGCVVSTKSAVGNPSISFRPSNR
jgi:hypothetical protein